MQDASDWNQKRKTMLLTTQRIKACNPSFWDKCADDYNLNNENMKQLTENQMRKMSLAANQSVLEIGAGNGRITIPVAKKVKQVTAIEPSKKMLEILKINVQKENLTNISYMNRPWEEVKVGDVFSHDVVLASFSLFMVDIAKDLQKMDTLAKKCVYLFASASSWMDKEIQEIVYANNAPVVLPDYKYICNILEDLDIDANIQIWDYEFKRDYPNIDEAVKKLVESYNISPEKNTLVREYLQDKLVKQQEKLVFKQTKKVALIWWDKTN
jgi:ubiquinone/menaquinone biosynthesis C-methylase UbiE